MLHCDFCDELELGYCPSMGRPLTGRIIHETENFVVFPTVGGLVSGWVLLVSKRHERASGLMTINEIWELQYLMDYIESLLSSWYDRPVVFFEHGPGERLGGGACINHVHIHAVPVPNNFNLLADLQIYKPQNIQNLINLRSVAEAGNPYLFYQDICGQRFQAVLYKDTPSQFMRRIVAKQLGRPDHWDWGVFPELQMISQTVHDSCPYCQQIIDRRFVFDDVDYGDRIIAESNYFFVMSPQGCIVPGYLLVIAKHHLLDIWRMSDDIQADLKTLMQMLRSILQEQFGYSPVFFDHGSSPRSFPHAHLHVVPIQYSGPPRLNVPHKIVPVTDFGSSYGCGSLQWGDSDGQWFRVELWRPRQYQLLRRVIAKTIGRPEAWDWRYYPFIDNLLLTRDKLMGKIN